MRSLNFTEYSKNEVFGIFKSKKYEFDERSKEVFKNMLDSIETLQVTVFSDYRRESSFIQKSGGSEIPNKTDVGAEGTNSAESDNLNTRTVDEPQLANSDSEDRVKSDEKNSATNEKSVYPLMIKNLTSLRDLLSQYKNITIEDEQASETNRNVSPGNLENLTTEELINIDSEVELDKQEIENVESVTVDVAKDSEKSFDDFYKELLNEWKSQQKKEEENTSPGEGTRARLGKKAQYKLLLTQWKKSQKESGENTNPGLGTRNRLMRVAKEWFESTRGGKYEPGKIYTYTNKKGEKKKVKLLSITHHTEIGPDKEWITGDDTKKEKLNKGLASILFLDKNSEYSSKSRQIAVKLSSLTESVLSFSEFLIEANFFGKSGKSTIRKKETDLIKSFTKIKKSISVLMDEKDKGVSITSQFCEDVLLEKMKSKEVIVALYKEIWEHLYGKYKSTMPKLDNLYKENINITKEKKKIVAEKISIFSLRSIQFDKEGLYGGLSTFGDSLETFNESLKQIMNFFNSKVQQITEEVKVNRFFQNKKETRESGKRISVVAMKGSSKHRLSSKLLGAKKEDSYSISINNQHFVGNQKGKEGEPLVNPKISEMFYNFLDEIGKIQITRKKDNLTKSQYDSKLSAIKNKYQSQLAKFK